MLEAMTLTPAQAREMRSVILWDDLDSPLPEAIRVIHVALRDMGLVVRVGGGWWDTTDAGRAWLAANPEAAS